MPSPRTATGTAAISGLSGSSPAPSSHLRSAPAHVAVSTSLIVRSYASATSCTSGSGSVVSDTSRFGVIERFSVVLGPVSGSVTERPAARIAFMNPTATDGRCAIVLAVATGMRAIVRSIGPTASSCDRGGAAMSAGAPLDGLGSRSKSAPRIPTAAAPSMIEWWTLATTAARPSPMSSTTSISQRGRSRRSGVRNVTAASWARPGSPSTLGFASGRMCSARSTVSSWTQCGSDMRPGTSTTRRRKASMASMRSATTRAIRLRSKPSGPVDGSNTSTPTMCQGVLRVSLCRNAASTPLTG